MGFGDSLPHWPYNKPLTTNGIVPFCHFAILAVACDIFLVFGDSRKQKNAGIIVRKWRFHFTYQPMHSQSLPHEGILSGIILVIHRYAVILQIRSDFADTKSSSHHP